MQSTSVRRLRLAANAAIVVVVVALAGMLALRYWPRPPVAPIVAVQPGETLTLPGVSWDPRATLLLAVSTRCRFCSDSAAFYRQLLPEAARQGIPVVAVSPERDERVRGFLHGLRVPITQVKQVDLRQLRIAGTPTLVLVDGSGRVLDVWRGRLTPSKETKVLDRVKGVKL
jgi:hypothetical protein